MPRSVNHVASRAKRKNMMKLAKGDELKLSSDNYLHGIITSPITFIGNLIHIENWTTKTIEWI